MASRARLRLSPPSSGQRRHQRAQPRPRETHVAIGGIVGEGDLRPAQRRDELRFRNVQQRPRQPHAFALGLARHRRETGDAAAAQHPHQQRLGLVVAGMRGQDVRGAARPRGLRQQPIARRAGRGRQSRVRFGAGPAQRAVRQIERSCETLDVARLARGFGAQAVVDGDGDQSRPARQRAAPARRKPHQGERIGTAGDRQHDRRRGLPVREQILRLLHRDRGLVVVRASACIASLCEADGGLDRLPL